MKKNIINHILLICFFLLFFFYGCESVPIRNEPSPGSPGANAPKMAVGDSWTYKGWNRGILGAVDDIWTYTGLDNVLGPELNDTFGLGPGSYTVKVVEVKSDGSFKVEKTSKKGNKRLVSTYNSMHRRTNPPEKQVLLNFPLFVGKTWEGKNHDGCTQIKYTVVKYAHVDTKAGKFIAFKISRVESYLCKSDNPDRQTVFWYSPEVKAIVKETPSSRYGLNLLSYQLGPEKIALKSKKKNVTPKVKQSKQKKVITATDKAPQVKQSKQQKVITATDKAPQVKQNEQQKVITATDKAPQVKQNEQQKVITATDKAPQVKQNEQQKVITGTDKPKLIIKGEKVKIGIIEFQSLNDEAKKDDLGKIVSEMLTTSLVNSELFKIIEREQLKKVLHEFQLSQSGIIDTSHAKQIGKLSGADAIVTGSVIKMGNELRLDARMIDVESGIILTAEKSQGNVNLKSIGMMTDQIIINLSDKYYKNRK